MYRKVMGISRIMARNAWVTCGIILLTTLVLLTYSTTNGMSNHKLPSEIQARSNTNGLPLDDDSIDSLAGKNVKQHVGGNADTNVQDEKDNMVWKASYGDLCRVVSSFRVGDVNEGSDTSEQVKKAQEECKRHSTRLSEVGAERYPVVRLAADSATNDCQPYYIYAISVSILLIMGVIFFTGYLIKQKLQTDTLKQKDEWPHPEKKPVSEYKDDVEKGLYPSEGSHRFEKDDVQLVSESEDVDEHSEEALPPSHPVPQPLPPSTPVQPTPPITKLQVYQPEMIPGYQPATLLSQFLAYAQSQHAHTSVVATKWDGVGDLQRKMSLLVPCIAASRIGSDVSAACTSLKIPASMRSLLILLHPRAHHNSKVYPTRNKMSDFVERMEYILDVVFWNDKVYDCDQNRTAATELVDFLKAKQL